MIVFLSATLLELQRIIQLVDCVFEFDLAPPDIRDWLLQEHSRTLDFENIHIAPPASDAPIAVILDTGIASEHPLLGGSILSKHSVIPGQSSPEDIWGHGTRMAGVALFDDLGAVIQAGGGSAPHWIQSVRLLVRPQVGTATSDNRRLWPKMTENAVLMAEQSSPSRPRTFALAVTAPSDDPERSTSWSDALDRLAYKKGEGRIICVSIGNAPATELALLQEYPRLNLGHKIDNPAHAKNVLTIGAWTRKATLPPDPDYRHCSPVAASGEISPHSRSGVPGSRGAGIKPEVVFEGGNIAFDGSLPSDTVETLTTLSTGHRFRNRPLVPMNGTSAATAEATNFVSRIWERNPTLHPATVRGLVVHSATWTPEMRNQFPSRDDLLSICGYGAPQLDIATGCLESRATVFVESSISNAIIKKVPKKKKPKRITTRSWEPKVTREVKLFDLPVPEEQLLDLQDEEVELRVTLSYFAEPNTVRGRTTMGLDLEWDMQGPQEKRARFLARINKLHRGQSNSKKRESSFAWEIGKQNRSRGTVQSDRWRGPASYLAGAKTVAVYPVLRWWDKRADLKTASMPFSLIVTVFTPGIDVYTSIKNTISLDVDVRY